MRAVITTPDSPGRLIAVDAPPPSAAPDLAVVRVRASSINRGETRLVPMRPNGWAPGQDLAGIVETPATGGGPARGTRVVGLADGGAWSELVPVPLERLAVLPDAVTFEQGACLGVAGLTPLRALRALGDVVGRELLVTGVSGGTGNVAAQLALAAGAMVTGLARTAFALDECRGRHRARRPALRPGDRHRRRRCADRRDGAPETVRQGHVLLGSRAGHVRAGPGQRRSDLCVRQPRPLRRRLGNARGTRGATPLTPLIDRVVPVDDVNDALAALNAHGGAGKSSSPAPANRPAHPRGAAPSRRRRHRTASARRWRWKSP